MENTASFIFNDTDSKFFVALRGKAYGPWTAHEVYEKIRDGEATLLNYTWCEGMSDWTLLKDTQDFKVLVPQKPSPEGIAKIRANQAKKSKPAPRSDLPGREDVKETYLYFNESQYGPFSKLELRKVLESGKVRGQAFVWMQGWATWKNIAELPEFADFAAHLGPPAPPAPAQKQSRTTGKTKKERRTGPRRPLVAKLFVHNDKEVIVAVCRDISVGGMQVLTDQIPGAVGSTIKLNVSPSDQKAVKGFVAEGEIVRILEDGRGFSFRFSKISADAKRALEKYLKSEV